MSDFIVNLHPVSVGLELVFEELGLEGVVEVLFHFSAFHDLVSHIANTSGNLVCSLTLIDLIFLLVVTEDLHERLSNLGELASNDLGSLLDNLAEEL